MLTREMALDRKRGLLIEGVSKAFNGKIVLRKIDLAVRPGEVVLLKGRNGSGKSTLVNLISGVYPLEEGEIFLNGTSIKREPQRAKAAVTTVFQETLFNPLCSPLEALYTHMKFYKGLSKEQVRQALEEFGVTEQTRPIFQLSGGTKKKVELLKAKLIETPIYLFDEPFAGLDATSRQQVQEWIRTRKRQGRTILLVSHELGGLNLDLIDRTMQLEAGQIIPAAPKEGQEMLVEAIVKGWKDEDHSALESLSGFQVLEVQKVEPTEEELEGLLKSMGLDKLGKKVAVVRVEGAEASKLLKGLGGAAHTISLQQGSAFRTRLKLALAVEIPLAQVARALEEHGLEVLQLQKM